MKFSNETGYTIIETMLFLGISGLLVTGILAGAGASINTQRYRDSVSSLQSVLQQQYSEVSNVSNDGTSGSCDSKPRGQSDCVILGRYITTIDGKNLLIQDVIGKTPSSSVSSLNDVEIFKENGYTIQISSSGNTTYVIEWSSSLVNESNIPKLFSMLILRSPNSGIVRTFLANNPIVGIQTLLTKEALLNTEVKMCVDSNGLFTGARMAVQVMKNIAGASGIEVLEEAGSGC